MTRLYQLRWPILVMALALGLTIGVQTVRSPAADAAQRVVVGPLTTVLGPDTFAIVRFEGVEAISQPYRYELDLVSSNRFVDAAAMIGTPVSFRVRAPGAQRWFGGVISRFDAGDLDGGRRSYRAHVVPELWLASLTADLRWYQDLSTPDIVASVLDDFGLTDVEFRLEDSYPARDCTAQYRETDLDFVSRLMEEEGMSYYFEHGADGETLVITDVNATAPRLDYAFGNGVTTWARAVTTGSSSYALDDYNFLTPRTDLTAQEASSLGGDPRLDVYDYPGGHQNVARGGTLSGVRMEALDATRDVRTAATELITAQPGRLFRLTGHPDRSETGDYYATAVRHTMEGSGARSRYAYENDLTAIPTDVPFRPQRVTPKPHVMGPQTAIVVGPAGEEIYTDEYGRVKVQFHWDRYGKLDEDSSCWIRVAQDWSDARTDASAVPRIGDEVLVDFLEGDPDRPIVVGRMYNAEDDPTPAALPTDQSCPSDEFVSEIAADGTPSCAPVTGISNGGSSATIGPGGDLTIDVFSLHAEALTVEIEAAATASIGAGATLDIDGAIITLNGPGTPAARITDSCFVPAGGGPCFLTPGSPTVFIGP